jgi:ParB family chromosome partitioning protein
MDLDRIVMGERLRAIDPDWVAALAQMIAKSGLEHPIVVARMENDLRYRLVAGAHRLAAHRLLDRDLIEARVAIPETDKPELEFRLAEIAENVGRRELSALDRAAHLAEMKRVHEELYPDTKRGVAGGKARQGTASEIVAVAADAAARIGLSSRTFFAAVALWNGLAPDTRARLRGTRLADHGAELVRLSKLDHARQAQVLDLLLSDPPRARRVEQAVAIIDEWVDPEAPAEKDFARLVKAWERASKPARRQFLAWLGDEGQSAVGSRQSGVEGEAA